MKRQSRELLAVQLEEALLALRAGDGEAFEVAVLAGLLNRGAEPLHAGLALTHKPPRDRVERALAEARQLRDGGGIRVDPPLEDAADAIVTQLYALSEEPAEDEYAELLLDLDELCAGSAFLGQSAVCLQAAQEAAAAIRAFPALYASLASWASQLLAEEPPVKSDPAWLFWRAIEACLSPAAVDTVAAPMCDAARRQLGIPVLVSRRMVGGAPQAMLASSGLPPTPTLLPLGSGPGFELGLGRDAAGDPSLLIACSPPVTLHRGGQEVSLERLAPDLLHTPACVGSYVLRVGEEDFIFEVLE